MQAVIPAVLPDERDYTRALSLSRLAYDLESLLSPALAAALLTVVAYDDLFLGTVVGFIISAGMVLATRFPDIPPADEPIDPNAQKMAQGEDRHMSYPEASAILMELARKRSMSIDQVNALEMAVRRLMCRHFQRQRNWAKRRSARSACGDSVAAPHPEPLSPAKAEGQA